MSASNKLIQAAAGVGGEEADADFANTVLLLNADDASNGGQNNTFLDSSSNTHTLTRNGNVTQGSFSPFSVDDGKWGNYFDGSGDYLVIDDGTLNPSAQDMTYEMWLYLTSTSAGLVFEYDDGSTGDLQLYHAGSGGLQFKRSGGGEPSADATISINEWVHIACVIDGTTLRIFVNGVEADSDTTTAPNSETQLNIGSRNGGTVSLAGYISNFRVVSGTALYTTGFTPSTTPLTDVSGTSLLTCQSNRFVDNSSNAHSITVNGTPKVVPFSPFPQTTAYDASTNGGSGYFDGSGDYLSIADDASLEVGSDDFTLECWLYSTASSYNNAGIIGKWDVGAGSRSYAIYFGPSSNLSVATSTDGSFQSSNAHVSTVLASYLQNEWNHIRACKSGTDIYLFVNGNSVISDTVSSSVDNGTQDFYIGTFNSTDDIEGYITDARFINGTALSTTDFTPPTAPLTDVTNTELLCNFTNASIKDATGKNVLETVGNAQVDTTTKKYGTGSMEFDGTGDYLKVPQTEQFGFGTGDYTVEAWIYPTSASANEVLFDMRISANLSAYLSVAISSGQLRLWRGAGSDSVNVGAYTANQWQHIAVTRSGSTIRFFIDGTQSYTVSDSTNLLDGQLTVGARWDNANNYNGYIDDLRITKGIARYTANFTPPEAALPVIGE